MLWTTTLFVVTRATPEQAAQHNEIVAVIREQMLAGDDVDSEAEFLEDDFDFL